jgi:hypothetical protein
LGWAWKGSQRQIQAYVNTEGLTERLGAELRDAFPVLEGAEIDWRAPRAAERYEEPCDETFWAAIERPELAGTAASWWPKRGPEWDAVGLARRQGLDQVVVLIEAKAHPDELGDGAMGATSETSISMIKVALDKARVELKATGSPASWVGPHYQLANRVAWVRWLQQAKVDAVLAHVLFEDDRSHKPASRQELEQAVESMHRALGIQPANHIDWMATIYLPAIG